MSFMRFKVFLLLIILLFSSFTYGQVEFSGSINLEAYYSNDDKLPFWFYTNQRGRISQETNIAGLINGKLHYIFSETSKLEIGAGLFYDDAFKDEVFLDELYAEYNYSWLEVIAGRRQEKELYNGLSATNQNFAWSLNARPMPGIQIQTSRPVYLNKDQRLGLEFSWEEYLMGDDRFVKGTRLHSKSIFLNFQFGSGWKIKGGISHYAQWGGESPIYGKQPVSIKDYLKVIAGREGGENAVVGDRINVIGSHLGVYELYLKKEFADSELKFIYNHFFEDGSGSKFANFPDGRYGIFYEVEDSAKWLNSFLYEFYYTRDQSQTPPYLFDYYFNNSVYASGWTYQNRVVGLPLLTTNYYSDYIGVAESIKVGNNSIIAHHIGIAGHFFKLIPYKLLTTYRKNYGHYRSLGYSGYEYYSADDPRGEVQLNKNVFSTRLDLKIPFSFLSLKISIGGDFSNSRNNMAAGLGVSKRF